MMLRKLLSKFNLSTKVIVQTDGEVLYEGPNSTVPFELEEAYDVEGAWVADDTLVVEV